jgi:hypothetical protein
LSGSAASVVPVTRTSSPLTVWAEAVRTASMLAVPQMPHALETCR